MATTGHEHERVEVQGLKASLKKGGNIGIYNDCICSTAGATAAKVTNTVPPSFTLTAKAKILVKFTYGINVANATLQVGENAAKPIFYQGSALDAGRVKAGMFVLMQYDGTNFNILGDIAKMDEYYKDLHAGLADNLFGETQTNDKFIFRPTAGIQDIESGEPPVGGGAIRKVEGNAVVWNQICNDGEITILAGSTGLSGSYFGVSIPNYHKVYISAFVKKSTDFTSSRMTLDLSNGEDTYGGSISYADIDRDDSYHRICGITLNINSLNKNLYYRAEYSQGTVSFKNVNVIDLTLLFGSGNEPSTVEAFESWLSQNIGLKSYYPYNAGELIPVKDYKVKSVGFNAWDEQWEVGYIWEGGNAETPNNIRCVNYIPVIGGSSYVANTTLVGVYYDSHKKWISDQTFDKDIPITIPSNVAYFRFYLLAAYGTTYNDDVSFNLYYDDLREGDYEPYEEHQVNIDVTKIYGKLNGSGDYVQVFPDGMKRTSENYFDVVDLKNAVATVKVKSVDLSTHSFNVNTENKVYYCSGFSTTHGFAAQEGFASRYNRNLNAWNFDSTNMSCVIDNNTNLYVHDESYTSLSDFTNSLQGVVFYGRLTTPLTYTDLIYRNNGVDIPVSEIKYAVDDYGTEEVLLGNDEDVVSCAPTMTIKYGINAADTIADLPHDYVSCKPQSLVDSEQRTARANIAAASQHDMDVVKKQLELIDKKVENDYWVDMGLPSGVIWAKRNIFTGTGNDMGFAPSEYSYDSDYFSWGNTDGHIPSGTTFDYSFDGTTYASTEGAKLTGNIPLSQDAARVHCGEPWRLPTDSEFVELFANCDFVDANGAIIPSTTTNKLIAMSGITGIRLKSKINGKFLFFPCSGLGYGTTLSSRGSEGYYWSSSLYSATYGRDLGFNSGSVIPQDNGNRFYGFNARPVM